MRRVSTRRWPRSASHAAPTLRELKRHLGRGTTKGASTARFANALRFLALRPDVQRASTTALVAPNGSNSTEPVHFYAPNAPATPGCRRNNRDSDKKSLVVRSRDDGAADSPERRCAHRASRDRRRHPTSGGRACSGCPTSRNLARRMPAPAVLRRREQHMSIDPQTGSSRNLLPTEYEFVTGSLSSVHPF